MSSDEDEMARCSDRLDSSVRLIVGKDKRAFDFNETTICNYCPFFANTFTGNFLEAQTKTLTLPDDEPERFAELARWLNGSIPTEEQSWLSLSTIWLFADKYHIDKLQNAVIDALYQKFAAHEEGINISFETLDYIADATSQNRSSPLRRLFADMLANGISLQQLPSRVDQIPPEFLQDMVLALKRTIFLNSPTDISLLTNPVSSYYSSSVDCKMNFRPASPPPVSMQPSNLYCDGFECSRKDPQEPIRGMMHICTNHNLKLCHECRNSHRGYHRKKFFTFTTAPYRDAVTGDSLVVDGHINDHGFYCDGPKCDPEKKRTSHQPWEIMSGDRYHCLECDNLDFCSICIRGPLECKEGGHSLLRIRPTFAKHMPLTEQVNIKLKQERAARQACWRCGSEEHETTACDQKAVIAPDVEMED